MFRWQEGKRLTWWQFAAWALCGASAAFVLVGAFAVGPLAIVPTALFALLAVRLGGANLSSVGVVTGIGAWCFVVAWLNRGGPGNVCTTDQHGTLCQSEWAPWPFWIAGALSTVIPLVLMAHRRVRARHVTA